MVYVPLGAAGGQGGTRHVMEVAAGLAGKGVTVEVFCAGRSEPTVEITIGDVRYRRFFRGMVAPESAAGSTRAIRRFDVRQWVRRLLGPTVGRGLRKLDSYMDARRIAKWVIEHEVDVIYERSTSYSRAGEFAAKKSGIPFVVEVNDVYQSSSTLAAADRIIVPEPRSLPAKLRSKSIKLPWGVDAETVARSADAERARRTSNETPTIIFVGSFLIWHGAELLLSAAQIVADKGKRANYLFVGDGPNFQEVRRIAESLAISELVTFTGLVSMTEVGTYLGRSDIAVAPYSEQLSSQPGRAAMATPLKVLEYMAAALPVVISQSGNECEVIDEASGLVYKTGDADALAQALISLIDSQPVRAQMGEAGRRQVFEKYTWSAHTASLIDVFKQTVHAN